MTAVRIHNPYDPPGEAPGVPYGKSMTRQSEMDSCDINKIMARYEKTGELPEGVDMFFADCASMGDFRDVQEKLNVARDIFYQLPAGKRAEFDNNVAAFLDYAADPANKQGLVELGLVPADKVADEPAKPAAPAEGGAAAPPEKAAGAA